MTVVMITAQQTSSPAGGIVNPHLTNALHEFEVALWPPATEQMGRSPAAVLTGHFPVAAAPRTLSAQGTRSYSGDFYHRVHITPEVLNLGNVVSTQTTAVYVWNAHLVSRTLTAIAGAVEGILLEGQSAPPLLVHALEELTWQLSVTPDGQPVLDQAIQWAFDNGEVAQLRVRANRIIAWAFAPDWADGVRERLEWLTEILQSESLAEQRRAMRTSPRRLLSAPMYVEGRERQLLDLALLDWGARVWALPIWPDIQLLAAGVDAGAARIDCETTHRDFVAGGLALLRGETAFAVEVVEILAVDAAGLDLKRPAQRSWPVGSRLYPARAAQLMEEPDLVRLTDTAQSASVQFLIQEVSDWPAALPSTLYRGWPVLEARPNEAEDITSQYARLLATLDSGVARPLISDIGGRALPVRAWHWLEQGRAARAALRSLLYALRGRQVAMWIPTHADDLTLVAPVTAIATTLDVASIGYARFGVGKAGRRDIRIELSGGAVFHRRITGATEVDEGVERLSIDDALGMSVAPSAVRRICWLTLSRGNSDEVEIEHHTDADGVAACKLVFRGVRDDEL